MNTQCASKILRNWRSMPEPFTLHPQLAADTLPLSDLELCTVRLMNNAALPWVILVPRQPGMRDTIDLPEAGQLQLMREISQVSLALKQAFKPDKLNMAALGNMVPQLHVHIIARFSSDAAWPKPVWGNLPAQPYTPAAAEAAVQLLQQTLKS